MPIVGNLFYPDEDVIGRREDGRGYLVAAKNVPMNQSVAVSLGLLAAEPPRAPYEKKPAERPQETGTPVTGPQVLATVKIDATASAKKLAAEYGISLAGLQGTGSGGRITKYDVEAAIHDREAVEE